MSQEREGRGGCIQKWDDPKSGMTSSNDNPPQPHSTAPMSPPQKLFAVAQYAHGGAQDAGFLF